MAGRVLTLVALLLAAGLARAATADAPLVLTGTQATYSIALALVAGTPIQVRNIPADGRELAVQRDYIERRKEALAPVFAAADAVITLTNALPADPLYRYARAANIRVIAMDAALPWGFDAAGVALADAPRTNVPWGGAADASNVATAPYFWLSVANAIRMADLVAADLAALYPDAAAPVAANREALKRSLLQLRADFQQRLLETGSEPLFALTGDFVYLTNDMGLAVDGYFIRQDVQWTAADRTALTQHLREHGIRVVLHKWQPDEAIQAAIRAGGATLVVLQTGDPGSAVDGALPADGLQRILRANLESLYAALRGNAPRQIVQRRVGASLAVQ